MRCQASAPCSLDTETGARRSEALDRLLIPGDTEPWLRRGESPALLDAHACPGERVELRDVFDPARVGHRATQRDMEFHQEVWANRYVEGLCKVGDLQPRRDAADAGNVDLYDRTCACLQVLTKVKRAVHALADGDGDRRLSGKAYMPTKIVGRKRFLKPCDVDGFVMTG